MTIGHFRAALLSAFVFVAGTGFDSSVLRGASAQQTVGKGDPITGFSDDNAQMNAAMAEARATLPVFLAHVTNAQGRGAPNATLKVAFPATDGGREIIWVGDFRWDGRNGFTGRLDNQPNFMGNMRVGDAVEFTSADVRDWSVTGTDGQLWGNYTTRVMLPMIDPQTASLLRSRLSRNPVPSSWN